LLGNTHEDIDGLFGVEGRYLQTKTWNDVDELMAHMGAAFSSIKIPVINKVLEGSLDFTRWFHPVIDSTLGNFSHQHTFNPGMHAFR
jgi:hypothetical protein